METVSVLLEMDGKDAIKNIVQYTWWETKVCVIEAIEAYVCNDFSHPSPPFVLCMPDRSIGLRSMKGRSSWDCNILGLSQILI